MINRERYREFCEQEKNIPIFSKPWWLDSVCGKDNWEVLLYEKGGNIWASMPLFKEKKYMFDIITMPKLTQTMGAYIKYPKGQKYYKKLSWEKELMNYFISNLPKYDAYNISFSPVIENWLPYYWEGFTQTTRYSYVINNTTIEELSKNFETDIRRRRKKADKLGIVVNESDNIKKFYELNKMTFTRQNKTIPYSFEFIKNLYENCKENNSCKIFFAKDIDKNVIASNFLLYDDSTVYYLMGGMDSKYKDMGGMDVIQYESIKFALESGRTFDFEGSMIESIEKYFRSFGAIQQPYFNISKTNSKLLKTRNFIKEIIL